MYKGSEWTLDRGESLQQQTSPFRIVKSKTTETNVLAKPLHPVFQIVSDNLTGVVQVRYSLEDFPCAWLPLQISLLRKVHASRFWYFHGYRTGAMITQPN